MNVAPGQPAPDFTLPDQDDAPWSLLAHRGQTVVLYFYPADDTPGCTKQACDVRDHWAEFAEAGATVVGISPDDARKHRRFADKFGLPHTLLADVDRHVIKTYGAWGLKQAYGRESEGVLRSSVVIDPDGVILAAFDKIKPEDQSAKALAAIRGL